MSIQFDSDKGRALQIASGGLAAVTAVGAVVADGNASPVEPVDPIPTDTAHIREVGPLPTLDDLLSEQGLKLTDLPPAVNAIELRAKEQPAVHAEPTVPHHRLKIGMGEHGPREDIRNLQEILQDLGFFPKKAPLNGVFGPRLERAVGELQDTLRIMGRATDRDGIYGAKTARSLAKLYDTKVGRKKLKHAHAQLRSYTRYAPGERYAPHSERAKDLFRAAARLAGLPVSWASSSGLHNILAHESDGRVGIPNYTYGSRRDTIKEWKQIHRELRAGRITAVSSATGLGQLLNYNVDTYYPKGAKGIGVPLQEAIGMLRYISARYGNPDNAWHLYNTLHEGY